MNVLFAIKNLFVILLNLFVYSNFIKSFLGIIIKNIKQMKFYRKIKNRKLIFHFIRFQFKLFLYLS